MMSRMTGGRPLMTDHLQDLELELQLLKRKRQMIQQAHGMTRDDGQRHFGRNQQFNQQPFIEPSHGQNFNFTQLYSDYGEPSNFGRQGRQFSNKRQAGNWQEPIPPKRFSGPQNQNFSQNHPKNNNRFQNSFNNQSQRPNNRNFQPPGNRSNNAKRNEPMRPPRTQRPEPGPVRQPQANVNHGPRQRFRQPKPLMDIKTPQPNSKPQANLRNNFKAKAAPKPPNKLNSYPQAQKNALVAKTKPEGSAILYEDKVPSRLVTGRLELVLGQIMKQIKDKYESEQRYSLNFKLSHHQKLMKQGVRDRLRQTMLGKSVAVVSEVIKAYRDAFPPETDRDIVELPLESIHEQNKISKILVDTADPRDYYTTNMKTIVSMKLEEMFSKLKKLYKDDNELIIGMKFRHDITDDSIIESARASIDEEAAYTDAIEDKKVDTSVAENSTSAVQNGDSKKQESEASVQVEIKDEAKVTKEIVEVNKEVAEVTKEGDEVTKEATEVTKKDVEVPKEEENKEKGEENSENDVKKIEVDIKTLKLFNEDGTADLENMDVLISKLIPEILPKFKNTITKILGFDRTFKYATNSLAHESSVRSREFYKDITPKAKTEEKPNTETKGTIPPNQLFYVKIFGRPTLPKRSYMQEFLDKFSPKSIKKHKGVKNLLFVGFADQESQESILAKNKIFIGKCSLSIKVSENVLHKKDNGVPVDKTVTADATKDESNISINEESAITQDLDDQIEDLLSSIRKADEDDNVNTDGTTESDEKPAEDTQTTETVKAEVVKDEKTVENGDKAKPTEEEVAAEEEAADKVDTGDAVKGTPTRSSTRIANATPGTIRTRRASKLAQ